MVTYLIILFVVVAVLFGSSAAGFLALKLVIWIVVILGVLSLFGFGFFYIRSPVVLGGIPTVAAYFFS
ncbi:MAG TPA: hypothetical protein VJ854_03540 [Sphaerochaeta sp.]|nr:hypothetical protein [Sphaerochaeta sp.]